MTQHSAQQKVTASKTIAEVIIAFESSSEVSGGIGGGEPVEARQSNRNDRAIAIFLSSSENQPTVQGAVFSLLPAAKRKVSWGAGWATVLIKNLPYRRSIRSRAVRRNPQERVDTQ